MATPNAAVPPARREFVPAPEHTGPADWRTALRSRAPRCGIGVALTLALISAALWRAADKAEGCFLTSPCDTGLAWSPWAITWAVVFTLSALAVPVLIAVIVRQRRRVAIARGRENVQRRPVRG